MEKDRVALLIRHGLLVQTLELLAPPVEPLEALRRLLALEDPDLHRRWLVEVMADVGGFDVGSKLSWRLFGAATYRASRLLSFSLGYNILDVDYRSTVASQDFVYRVTIGGPIAGIHFNF